MLSRNRISAPLLALLTAAPIFAPSFAAAEALAIKAQPVRAKWWRARHVTFNSAPNRGRAKVIFVGDSITSEWSRAGRSVWRERYARYAALNLGVGGDRTENLLWRLSHGNLAGLSPKVAVLLIGTNNLHNQSQKTIVAGIAANIAELRHRLPRARILLLALFPRGARKGAMRLKALAVNKHLVGLASASDSMVHVLDIGNVFVDKSGAISQAIMPDYLHLSERGYRRWADAMNPKLQELLKAADKPSGFVSALPANKPTQSGFARPAIDTLERYDRWHRAAAKRHGLDWKLAAAVRIKESFNDPNRVSTTGAVGLMQLMPAGGRTHTTTSYQNFIKARRASNRRFGGKSSKHWGLLYRAELLGLVRELPYIELIRRDQRFDARRNITAGTAHLARDRAKLAVRYPGASKTQLRKMMVAAYYTGRGRVRFRDGAVQIPSYAMRYVDDVMAVYRRLLAGKTGR